jgi:hypothetical protein
LELEKAAEQGAQRGVKIRKPWDSPDGYGSSRSLAICFLSSRKRQSEAFMLYSKKGA